MESMTHKAALTGVLYIVMNTIKAVKMNCQCLIYIFPASSFLTIYLIFQLGNNTMWQEALSTGKGEVNSSLWRLWIQGRTSPSNHIIDTEKLLWSYWPFINLANFLEPKLKINWMSSVPLVNRPCDGKMLQNEVIESLYGCGSCISPLESRSILWGEVRVIKSYW